MSFIILKLFINFINIFIYLWDLTDNLNVNEVE